MTTNPLQQNFILWADDDADDLFLVREAIENIDNSYQVIEASNGQQALDYLYSLNASASLPCLIVLDINMPVLNGKETLAILKNDERFKSITVAVFTTSNNEKDRLYCTHFGAQMFSKPHTYAGFEKMIGKLISYCKTETKNNAALN